MSKRAGTFVALRDVVDEVGCDPVRFMMMMRKHDSALDFDLAKVVEQSKDNPVFYVQYAHARAESVFRTAQQALCKSFEKRAGRCEMLISAFWQIRVKGRSFGRSQSSPE